MSSVACVFDVWLIERHSVDEGFEGTYDIHLNLHKVLVVILISSWWYEILDAFHRMSQ